MMKEWVIYAMRGVALVVLLTAFTSCSDSSNPNRSNANSEAEIGKQSAPSDRIPPRTFRHNIKVEEKYDKFLGINGIDAKDMQVAGRFPEAIQMSATFMFKSDKERGSFRLTFIVSGRYASVMEHSNPDVRRLLALADGQRIDLGTLEVVDSLSGVYILMTPDVPKQRFIQLVSAREVNMQLGNHELELTEEYLEAMRDVASRATN